MRSERDVWRLAVGVAALAFGLCSQALAAGFSASVGLLSDKVVYGNSQSGGRTSAVLDTSYRTADGWALGAGLASLGGGPTRADAEATASAGYGAAVGDNGAWQATYTRNHSVASPALRRPGFNQLGVAYGWAERLQVSALLSLGLSGPAPAPARGRTRGHAGVVDVSWHQPLGQRFALDLGAGHVNYSGVAVPAYTFGSVGVSAGVGPLQVFASRIFSDSRLPIAVGPRAVVSVLMSF